jgi:hypothetical protein
MKLEYFVSIRNPKPPYTIGHNVLEIELADETDLETINTKLLGIGAQLVDATTRKFLRDLARKRQLAALEQPHTPTQDELEDVFRP